MLTPALAHAYSANPEQSKPLVWAPWSMPRLGPVGPPPPQEYGTPIILSAAARATAPRSDVRIAASVVGSRT